MEVDCRAVRSALDAGDDLVLIDCREQEEFETARIEGVTLLPMSQLAAQVEQLELHRERTIVVHCHHGGRSLRVAEWLRSQGFPRAQSMAGGIDQWSLEIDSSVPRY
jgi:rhodanese-related sulfurtransferase